MKKEVVICLIVCILGVIALCSLRPDLFIG